MSALRTEILRVHKIYSSLMSWGWTTDIFSLCRIWIHFFWFLPSIFTVFLCHLISLIFSGFLVVISKRILFLFYFSIYSCWNSLFLYIFQQFLQADFSHLNWCNWIQRNAPQHENHTVDGCLKYLVPSCFIFQSGNIIPFPQQHSNGLISLYLFRNINFMSSDANITF